MSILAYMFQVKMGVYLFPCNAPGKARVWFTSGLGQPRVWFTSGLGEARVRFTCHLFRGGGGRFAAGVGSAEGGEASPRIYARNFAFVI